jgi:chitinase
MTYDLMNRRMNFTEHHTSVAGSLSAIETYINLGMSPSKLILGFAFYAKFFTTAEGMPCRTPTGCQTVVLEDSSGADTGLSGAVTFEAANYASDPSFANAIANGRTDDVLGGAWYWDAGKYVYWTWDTPELVQRKFDEIVKVKGLGGVMAWSLAQDSHDWRLFKAMQAGVKDLQVEETVYRSG